MNIKEYQKESKRTCPSLGSIQLDLSHMVLGLGSEIAELQEAIENEDIVNIGEELTDIMWYLSNYHTFRKYDLKSGENSVYYNIMDLTHAVSTLQDYTKKFIAYNKEISVISESQTLDTISEIIYSLYISNDLEQEKCLQQNIDKLYERFPLGFTTESAINRNTDKERKILES